MDRDALADFLRRRREVLQPDDVEDPEAQHLLRESEEFAALWERHEVARRAATMKRFVHPLIGPLTLDCQVLTSENLTEKLVVFTASPGSKDANQLALLAVVGSQAFPSRGAPDVA